MTPTEPAAGQGPDESGMEVWRPLPGRPRHQISSHGRLRGPKGPMLGRKDHGGYIRVGFDAGRLKCSVHSLVMLTFVGPRPEGLHIDHIDGDKTNNRVENLRYVTKSENELNKSRLGNSTLGRPGPSRKLTEAQVLEIIAAYNPAEYGAMARLARHYGVSFCTVRDILLGKSWKWLTVQAEPSPLPNSKPDAETEATS